MLSDAQKTAFWEKGFITIERAINESLLNRLCGEFDNWVEQSRQHSSAFGSMSDGRPRFDVEPEHCADHPALRRVASPTELSKAYLSAVSDSAVVHAVAALVGPDLRFHHSKVNSKLPGTSTLVKWHQDFIFDPHTNDDLITVMLFLDDVLEESGPPRLVPGSHRGPLYSLWHNGTFTGAVSQEVAEEFGARAVSCTGKRGSACLMHTRVAHASGENRSNKARTLFIFNIGAADAVPLSTCAVPSIHGGMIVHGKDPGRIRCTSFETEVPEVPEGASFFVQQAQQ